MADADKTGAQQVLKNAFKPFTSATMGSAEYVALEVVVSKMLRRFINAPRGWVDLAVVHALSLPFIGGLSKFMENTKSIFADKATPDGGWAQQLQDGAKGAPGVYLAEYIVNTFNGGIHMPRPALKDAGVTLVGKAITRPIAAIVLPYLPANLQESFEVLDILFQRQYARASAPAAPAAVSG